MLPQVAQLHEVITDLLTLDPALLATSELHELTVAVSRETHRLAAARAAAVEVWARSGVWASNGSRSPSQRLSRDANCSIGAARAELARARQLAKMPATAAALAEGDVSPDHVRLLGRANAPTREAAFAGDEELLVGLCTKLGFDDAQRAVDYWVQRVDADSVEAEAEEDVERNELHFSRSIFGRYFLDGNFDPVSGEIIANELQRLEQIIRQEDKRDGTMRTPAQRRAAAMVRMAERSAAKPKGAKKPRVMFHVHVGDDTLARLCELGNGKVIAPGQLLPYLGRADFESLLFDGPSTVISVSNTRRFAGAVRKAVLARDRRCQHPSGCAIPAERCDVDHVVAISDNGPTSQFNGQVECPAHNRLAHLHEHGTEPRPYRDVTVLDEVRARLRWRILHGEFNDDDDHETPAQARAATAARWAAEEAAAEADDRADPPDQPEPPRTTESGDRHRRDGLDHADPGQSRTGSAPGSAPVQEDGFTSDGPAGPPARSDQPDTVNPDEHPRRDEPDDLRPAS